MKISVRYKIVEKDTNKVLSDVGTSYSIESGTTISQLKNIISESVPMVQNFILDNQIIQNGLINLQDDEVLTKEVSLKSVFIVYEKDKKDIGFSSKHLGRKYVKDDRDKNFLIESLLTTAPSRAVTSKYWDSNGWWGDQGNSPQCVGYAWAHWIDDGPITHNLPHPNINPSLIYTEAQKVDEWIGENYDGTSVRGAAKYLKSQNKISAYYWAYDLNTLTNAVLNLGPVVVGTNWYYNMFFPDRNGLLKVSGYLAGGHAYVINGVDTVKKQFRIKNSWGKSWGQQGHAFISFNDMSRLIKMSGEICLATEVNF